MMASWPHYNSPRLRTISIALFHPLPVFSLEGFEFHRTLIPDPKKGIDRAWSSCQDKLLDLTGPLAKILEMALKAKETVVPIDPHILAVWTRRAICLLGNANCAISMERRKSLLMRIDLNLTELASADAGPLAVGRLFGDKFVKDIAKYVTTFTTLDKAQTSLKKVFHSGLFGRAGRGRGRSSGRGYYQGPQRGAFTRGQAYTRGGTFFPSHSRVQQRRGQRGGSRATAPTGYSAGKAFGFFINSQQIPASEVGAQEKGGGRLLLNEQPRRIVLCLTASNLTGSTIISGIEAPPQAIGML
ncbi:hypothetical protein NDU88_003427 [Pleurodeles waltl]|uniref:Uncharacterized protein n=1 Tax=Pleurodeles waltl TaxID=8319 RepID=A0AAV7LH29_PLEWA|nr:hypothetical protein NDU88_003427 [Pleurodeles waltl]